MHVQARHADISPTGRSTPLPRLLARTAMVGVLLLGVAAAAEPAVGAGPTFAAPADYSEGVEFGFPKRAVAAADLTNDGVPDLTIVGERVGVLRSTTNPTSPAEEIPTASDVNFFDETAPFNDVAIADLSGDGRPDIFAVGEQGGRRYVQEVSGGTRRFEPDSDRLLEVQLNAVAIGRLDGDALPDLVVVGPGGGWVIRQQAAGQFASPQAFLSGGGNLTDVALGDFGGDARTDIAVSGEQGARVLLQTGTFAFTPNGDTFAPGPLESLVAGHFDPGATLDVAASQPGTNQVLIRLGRGDAGGTFVNAQSVAVSDNPGALAAADLDLNGTTDLIVARRESGPNVEQDLHDRATVLPGGGDGRFSLGGTISVYQAGQLDQQGNDVRSIAVADVDLDGRPDLLFADAALSAAIVSRNTSTLSVATGGGGATRGGGVTGGGGGAGTRGPGLIVRVARRQALSLKAGIVVRATCAAACTLTASGRISWAGRRRKIALGKVVRTLRSGQSTRIVLSIPRRRWPVISRAQRRGSRVLATVVISARDARGTRATRTIVFRLVPPRPGRG
jgi:hypothetical protein